MAKVEADHQGRRLVIKGDVHDVHCAIREDGSSPAWEFLSALAEGRWEPDPDVDTLPDDEQIRDRDWFFSAIRHWANYGEPVYRHAINDLDNGIWEFKRHKKRLTFYDTDGQGGYEMKLRILDHQDADYPDSDHWQIPGFDEFIRLGHAFPKLSHLTSPDDLDQSETVREEDLAHDKL